MVKKTDLTKVDTCDLVKELKSREGVSAITAEPHQEKNISIDGPAVILVIID